MRAIPHMAVKDLRLMGRDWVGMFFILGFPILMAVFFGSMYGSVGDVSSASLSIAVVDEDQSTMSARFLESLTADSNVQIEKLPRGEAVDRVRRGRLVGMMAIPKGFGESAGILWTEGPAIQLGIDPSRKAEEAMLRGMILQSVGKLTMERFQDPTALRPLLREAEHEIAAANADELPAPMKSLLLQLLQSVDRVLESWEEVHAEETRAGDGPDGTDALPELQLARIDTIDVTREIPAGSTEALIRQLRSKWDISFPQAMMWGVLACAAGFAVTFVRERKQGTLLRLQVAPVSRGQILAGKATACFLAVLGVVVVMVTLGVWLGMRPRSPLLLALASVSIAVCFVGIMMLMSVIGKTEEAVSGAAWSANMFMAMFGGAMVPLVFMPSFIKTLSDFSPVKWSILALEGSIWRGFTLADMLLPCVVLLATGAVCLALGSRMLARTSN